MHSADDWEELLLPEIERQQKHGKEVVVRADAAFAKPEIYEALEERGVNYAIRIPANENLERDIAELPPRQMIEYGYVLPEPGEEHVWTSALPTEDREFMQAVGR